MQNIDLLKDRGALQLEMNFVGATHRTNKESWFSLFL